MNDFKYVIEKVLKKRLTFHLLKDPKKIAEIKRAIKILKNYEKNRQK